MSHQVSEPDAGTSNHTDRIANVCIDTNSKPKDGLIKRLGYEKHIKHIHSLEDSFVDFCGSSSIHGVQYIGCRSSSYIEKLLWTIVFLITLYFAGTNIIEAWIKWEKNPVKTAPLDSVTFSWEIPFPAVTICPQTKSKRSLFEIMEAYRETEGDPNNFDDRLKGLLQLCDAPCLYNINYSTPASPNIVRVINEVAPTLEDVCESLTWNLDKLNCTGLFQRVLTEDGVCFSFNPISAKELFREDRLHRQYSYSEAFIPIQNWDPEIGYGSIDAEVEYPRRSFLDDKKIDLVINLRLNQNDFDYGCRTEQGFMVYVHSPQDFPQANYRAIYVPMGKSTYVTVKAKITELSQKLLQFPPESVSYTQISVHYNKEKFPTFERTDSYTLTELLGTFGGLLGLFMGVSLLSFVEIVYFCTLRPFCVWRGKHRKLRLLQQQANTRRALDETPM
ncbi:pickpocket protein 28-like [Malaya genurostris]|uniref:pickpocket protein 28-like n=1 Tax=Malaya genurostris TaxID=325434 RepID=UPI0026F3916A|nr:pickpocket protein 28-like [Malaya genurostris]